MTGVAAALALVAPLSVVMVLCFVAPLSSSTINSFHPSSPAGIDATRWTLGNYMALANPFVRDVVVRTVRIGIEICIITAVLAYPVALQIARLRGIARTLLLMVFVAPWLVNVAVKAAGWILLLNPNGPVNSALLALGVLDRPLELLFTETAIIIGLVHGHLMFVVLPLVAALEGIAEELPLAAANLGANAWNVFWRVTFPLTIPALAAGSIINFAFSISAFATPALLGGARVPLIPHIAYDINLIELNWPLGAAMAISLLGATLLLLASARAISRRSRGSREARL